MILVKNKTIIGLKLQTADETFVKRRLKIRL